MEAIMRNFSPAELARNSAEYSKIVLFVWLALVVGSIALFATYFADSFTTEFVARNNPETAQAEALIASGLRSGDSVQETIIIRSDVFSVDDPAFVEVVDQVREDLIALDPSVVLGAVSFFETGNPDLDSADSRSTIIAVTLAGKLSEAEANLDLVYEIVDAAGESASFETLITGAITFQNDFTEQAQADSETGESLAIPVVIIILAVIFGALDAVILPMSLAFVSIVITLGVAVVIGQLYDGLHVFTHNIVTMICRSRPSSRSPTTKSCQ